MGIESLCYLLPGALFLNYYENTRQGYCRKRNFMKKKKAALFMAVWMGAAGITGCAGAQNQAQSSRRKAGKKRRQSRKNICQKQLQRIRRKPYLKIRRRQIRLLP